MATHGKDDRDGGDWEVESVDGDTNIDGLQSQAPDGNDISLIQNALMMTGLARATGFASSATSVRSSSSSSSSRSSDDKKDKVGLFVRLRKKASVAVSSSDVAKGKRKKEEGGSLIISQPRNARHLLHVDFDYEWSGGDAALDLALLKKLGQGAVGSVYLSKHRETGFVMAIKSVPVAGGADVIDSMRKEVDMLKRLRDDYIVAYYGSCIRQSALWVMMEYCASGSVGDKLEKMEARKTPPSESDLAYILLCVVRGLEYLHRQLIAHRDIKAGNILITMSGLVKLADFGTAAQASGNTIGGLKSFTGTPLFMSPEVLDGGNYGTKADIWSLGITALQLAEFKPPRFGMHPMRALMVICSEPPPTLQNPGKWTPEFVDFVDKCLQKESAKRPTAEALLQHPFLARVPDDYYLSDDFVDKTISDWTKGYFVKATSACVPDGVTNEISFNEGDIIHVTEMDENSRLFGQTAEKSGWFSDFYVTRFKDPTPVENKRVPLASAAKKPTPGTPQQSALTTSSAAVSRPRSKSTSGPTGTGLDLANVSPGEGRPSSPRKSVEVKQNPTSSPRSPRLSDASAADRARDTETSRSDAKKNSDRNSALETSGNLKKSRKKKENGSGELKESRSKRTVPSVEIDAGTAAIDPDSRRASDPTGNAGPSVEQSSPVPNVGGIVSGNASVTTVADDSAGDPLRDSGSGSGLQESRRSAMLNYLSENGGAGVHTLLSRRRDSVRDASTSSTGEENSSVADLLAERRRNSVQKDDGAIGKASQSAAPKATTAETAEVLGSAFAMKEGSITVKDGHTTSADAGNPFTSTVQSGFVVSNGSPLVSDPVGEFGNRSSSSRSLLSAGNSMEDLGPSDPAPLPPWDRESDSQLLQQARATVDALKTRIADLELENARLRAALRSGNVR